MRVLHLDAGREMRGGQWQVLRLLEGLAAAGVESTLLARHGSPLFTLARQRGLPLEALGFARAAVLARRHDLIHAHDARGHTIGAIAGGAPLIVARRVAFPIRSRWKYARATKYIAISEFVKAVLMEGGVSGERISVVHDGVPALDQAHGDTLLAVSKVPGLLAKVEARAGIKLEYPADLERSLLRSRMLVYLTDCEGLGSGALLAMSAGVPVVASNVGGLREVIRDGENGLLVENTPEAIAAGIRRVLDDADFARRIGTEARRTVIQRFTVEQMIRRTMEVYRQILS